MLCKFWAVTKDFFSQVKWNFQLSSKEIVTDQSSLLGSAFKSFICLWVKKRQRSYSSCFELSPTNWVLNKAADLKLRLEKKGALGQIAIKLHTVHSDFRWLWAKAWKRSLSLFWIDCIQRLQQNWKQMKCDVWKPRRDLRWLVELGFSI